VRAARYQGVLHEERDGERVKERVEGVAESFETKSRVDRVRDLVGVVEREARSDHEHE
jgi:hypothetical protein